MIYVLDASAMIAYLRRETGAALVAACLSEPANESYAHSLNLCEVFYDFHRTGGEQVAQQVLGDLEFWQAAGRIKAAHRRVSLADCFAIRLATIEAGRRGRAARKGSCRPRGEQWKKKC